MQKTQFIDSFYCSLLKMYVDYKDQKTTSALVLDTKTYINFTTIFHLSLVNAYKNFKVLQRSLVLFFIVNNELYIGGLFIDNNYFQKKKQKKKIVDYGDALQYWLEPSADLHRERLVNNAEPTYTRTREDWTLVAGANISPNSPYNLQPRTVSLL